VSESWSDGGGWGEDHVETDGSRIDIAIGVAGITVFVVDLNELDLRELFESGRQGLGNGIAGAVGLALTLEEDAQDTVGEFDAAVTDKAIPDGGHTGNLFGGSGTAEVLIDGSVDGIGGREDLSGDGFFGGRSVAGGG
jgi:hypothetical protein